MEFTYDANGMRTKRTTGSTSTTYNYTYNGSQLTHMTYGSNSLHFYYDASGKPLSVVYNGTTYYYILSLQGDVVAILDSTGAAVVQYTYDAWGNILSTTGSKAGTLGLFNPLRYRGYVYDQETGLYYLQSRYYNPTICRFISADNYPSTGQGLTGNNMFIYCGNNPVSRADDGGECWHIVAGAVIGGLFELCAQLIANEGDITDINWKKVGIATAVGGITAACGPVVGALISGAGNIAMELASGTTDLAKIGISFAVGFGASFAGYGVGKIAQKIGGKIAVNHLAKQGPGKIKSTITKLIDVAGKDRNKIKNLTWAVSNYPQIPKALIGKTIPQIFNSLAVGVSGYGTMGAIYGLT